MTTEKERWEFIRRCKWLVEQRGARAQYRPARFVCTPWPDLQITWAPDECFLIVWFFQPNRMSENQSWSMVVEVFRGTPRWGWFDRISYLLPRMRKEMLLDDIAAI